MEILDDWSDALMKSTKKRKPPKPVAKPAFDPFQEVQVIDSRHLYKPPEDDEEKSSYSTMSGLGPQKRASAVHLRPRQGDILCESKDPIFYWTVTVSEVTCWPCKVRTPEEKERREGVKTSLKHKRRELKRERRLRPPDIVNLNDERDDFFS